MIDLLLSDLHLTERDKYRLDFLASLPDLLQKYQVERLYILGDITDRKDKHPSRLVNQIVDRIADVAQETDVIVLMGNHDHAHDCPFFRFLYNISGIRFVSKPYFVNDRLLLPHTFNYKRDWAELDFTGVKEIFTHNAFTGAVLESGQKLTGIPLDALPKVPIYSGDIHIPQRIGHLTYIGAPYTIRFGDDFEARAILLTDQGEKSIPLTGPQKRLIKVDATDSWRWFGTEAVHDGDIVRIEMQINAKDYKIWGAIRDQCESYIHHEGWVLESIRPIILNQRVAAVQREVKSKSDKQLVYDYCKRNNLDQAAEKIGVELL